jgi:hypothetical protein
MGFPVGTDAVPRLSLQLAAATKKWLPVEIGKPLLLNHSIGCGGQI